MVRAAERLAVSRPVVSRTIANLEQLLAVQLLDRTARGVAPTMFGEALLRHATVVFDELRQGLDAIAFLKDPQAGELRIACTEVWAAGVVPAAIERLMHRAPRVRVRMEQVTAQTQFGLLRERRCELAVTRLLADAPDPDIDMVPLFREPLVVIAGARSPWTRRPKLKLSDLVDAPWIVSSLELEDGSPFVKAFRAAKLPLPAATIVSNSLHLRNALLAGGKFLSLVPGSALHFGVQQTLLAALPVRLPRWHLPTGIFSLKGRLLSPTAQLFVDCVREVSTPLARRHDWLP